MSITVGKTGNIGQGADALSQLRGFTDGLQGSDRLRGHKGADGNITLHVRTGAPSFWTKVSPKAIYHRHLAQKAIARVLTNAERAGGGANLSAARNANAGGARSGLDRLFKSGEITGAASKVVSEGAAAIRSGAQKASAGVAPTGAAATQVDGRMSDDASTITIGNDTFSKVANKEAKGSEGIITFYRSSSGDEIAVKFMMPSDPESDDIEQEDAEKSLAMGREIEAHRQVGSAGHPNVLGFKGAIQGSDGRFGIAMEVAGSGTVEKASNAIKDALKAGSISTDTAQAMRLTLIKDVMEGMSHVNESSGMAHLDLKLDNVFLDGAGIAKIADFGKAERPSGFVLEPKTITVAEDFVPPEIRNAEASLDKLPDTFLDKGEKTEEIRRDFSNNFPNMTAQDKKELFLGIHQDRRAKEESSLNSGHDIRKWDAWAAGSTAFQILYERPLMEGKSGWQAREYVKAYGESGAAGPFHSNPETGKVEGGVFAGRSGNTDVDDLLTRLLAPTADSRARINDVKDHNLFQDPKIGSDLTRALIVELLKQQPDTAQIARIDDLLNLPG